MVKYGTQNAKQNGTVQYRIACFQKKIKKYQGTIKRFSIHCVIIFFLGHKIRVIKKTNIFINQASIFRQSCPQDEK